MALGVSKLEKAYRRNPRAPLFAHLAEIYLRKGDIPRALTLCLSGCKLFPDYPTGFVILGRCYEVEGDLENARRALLRGLLLDPVNPSGFGQLARICRQLGDLPMALKSMQKAANLDLFSESARAQLETLERQMQDRDDEDGRAGVAETPATDETASEPASEQSALQAPTSATIGEAPVVEPLASAAEPDGPVQQQGHLEPKEEPQEEPFGNVQDEPFARLQDEPFGRLQDFSIEEPGAEPVKSMKSAEEIQDDIDAFFDKMGAGAAAGDETPSTEAGADSLDLIGEPEPLEAGTDGASTSLDGSESLAALASSAVDPDMVDPDASEETAVPTSPSPSVNEEEGDDLFGLVPGQDEEPLHAPANEKNRIEGESPEAVGPPPDPETLGLPADPETVGPPADTETFDLPADPGTFGLPAEAETVGPPPDPETLGPPAASETVRPPADPEAVGPPAGDDLLMGGLLSLGEPSESEPPVSEPQDPPVDPLLVLNGDTTRPPESRVADLDGTAPAPGSLPDESDDLCLDSDEDDNVGIANLSPGEDQELVRLVQEIGGDGGAAPDSGDDSETSASTGGGIATATLAELYYGQGLFQRAIEVYQRLLEQEPDNPEFKRRIRELTG